MFSVVEFTFLKMVQYIELILFPGFYFNKFSPIFRIIPSNSSNQIY